MTAASRIALGQILDQLRGEPSRTWSIIITIYGDAIVPRGGCVWLGTLLSFFKALEIGDGVVRTAMSRLAADGWLERSKVGRNSFYRLAAKGHTTFTEATRHIYAARPPVWLGHVDLALTTSGPEREQARDAMLRAGFGSPGPGIFVAPGGHGGAPPGTLMLQATAAPESLRDLAARSWPVEATAEAYRRFIETFAPLRAALEASSPLDDLEALVSRVLLIHEYRRIVLRDPLLPAELLPPDWPGDAARALCGTLYRHLVGPSERWLDDNAIDDSGAALRPGREVFDRFKD